MPFPPEAVFWLQACAPAVESCSTNVSYSYLAFFASEISSSLSFLERSRVYLLPVDHLERAMPSGTQALDLGPFGFPGAVCGTT